MPLTMEQACEWQKLMTGRSVVENTTHWAATTSDQLELMTVSQGCKVSQIPPPAPNHFFGPGSCQKEGFLKTHIFYTTVVRCSSV